MVLNIKNMIKNLEYLFNLFFQAICWFYSTIKLVYYIITNKKCEPTIYNDHQKTKNEFKIKFEKRYLVENFKTFSQFLYIHFIIWVIYKIIVSIGIVEIIKIFTK